MCMTRPRRPGSERIAVRAAAARLPDSYSARQKAGRVAELAVAAYIADEQRTDPFTRAAHMAKQAFDPDPIEALATAEDGAIAARFLTERVKRFRGRAGLQIGANEWQAETLTIARIVQKTMERRFRDYLN